MRLPIRTMCRFFNTFLCSWCRSRFFETRQIVLQTWDTLLEREIDPVMLQQLSTRAKRIMDCEDEPTNASVEADTRDEGFRKLDDEIRTKFAPDALPPKPQKVLKPGVSSKLQRVAAALQKLNESGSVPPRSAGQRMERSIELEEEAYAKLNVAEKAFRKSWVESQMANNWENTDIHVKLARSLSVNKIIQEEGGA